VQTKNYFFLDLRVSDFGVSEEDVAAPEFIFGRQSVVCESKLTNKLTNTVESNSKS
jgi:hypothetical protein